MRIELSPDLLVQFPSNVDELGITFEKDKKDPWIDFRKGNRILSVFQHGNLLEVAIGLTIEGEVKEKTKVRLYRIEGDLFVEEKERPENIPLGKGERGEKIIDLSIVAEKNKTVAKFFELRFP